MSNKSINNTTNRTINGIPNNGANINVVAKYNNALFIFPT